MPDAKAAGAQLMSSAKGVTGSRKRLYNWQDGLHRFQFDTVHC